MFRYWGFGLHILSQIEFPELLPAEFDQPDVTIEIGVTPAVLEGEDVIKKPFSFIGTNEYLLNIRSICRYYAGYGSKIIAEPVPGIDQDSIRLFLLGSVMAAILYQRGSVPLHASAIVKDGELVIFAGKSGAGKSTLIAFLASKGYEIFTDDICVMHYDKAGENTVRCTASYPMIKLWEDALNRLENGKFNRDHKIRPELPKYGQFFFDRFNSSALPVSKVFILHSWRQTDEITVSKIPVIQSFRQLELQAYKHQIMSGRKLRALHFSLLTELTRRAPVYEVSRPVSGTNSQQLYQAIKNLL